jgi:hypothetical protein
MRATPHFSQGLAVSSIWRDQIPGTALAPTRPPALDLLDFNEKKKKKEEKNQVHSAVSRLVPSCCIGCDLPYQIIELQWHAREIKVAFLRLAYR